MRFLLLLILLFTLFMMLFWGYGFLSPGSHIKTRSFSVLRSSKEVYQMITDIHEYPGNFPAVVGIDVLKKSGKGVSQWNEYQDDGSIIVFNLINKTKNQYYFVQFSDKQNGMNGSLEISINGNDFSCQVQITEDFQIEEPANKSIFFLGLLKTPGVRYKSFLKK